MTKAAQQTQVAIPPMNIRTLEIVLVGDSSLISHAWSEKAKKMMLDKQMKKAMPKKEAKDPERDFIDSLYWMGKKPKNPTLADVEKAEFLSLIHI